MILAFKIIFNWHNEMAQLSPLPFNTPLWSFSKPDRFYCERLSPLLQTMMTLVYSFACCSRELFIAMTRYKSAFVSRSFALFVTLFNYQLSDRRLITTSLF